MDRPVPIGEIHTRPISIITVPIDDADIHFSCSYPAVNIRLIHVIVMLLLTPRAFIWGSSDIFSGNGLESDGTSRLSVLIELISEDAKRIGLSREGIEARVNQSLRKAGITPVATNDPNTTECALYVNVNVVGGSFSISVSFMRPVYYRSRDKSFSITGITWTGAGSGYSRDRGYILDAIAEKVEVFCNEFLKANGK